MTVPPLPNRFPLSVAFPIIGAILIGGFLVIGDPDFFWHLKTGEILWLTGTIPSTEIFSHTANGHPWIVQGWLSDIAMQRIWVMGGLMGMRVLVGAFFIAIWFFVYRSIRLYLARPESAVLLSLGAVALIVPSLHPRPTMVTMLFVSVLLFSLLRFRKSGRVANLYALPLVFAAWPNFHFGFVTGIGLWVLFLSADILARKFPIARQHPEAGDLLSGGAIVAFLASTVALGLNPHGYGVITGTIQMTLESAAAPIAEWQSPSFHGNYGKAFAAVVALFVFVRILGTRSIEWLDLIVPFGLVVVGYSGVRHLPLTGIVLMPFVARALIAVPDRSFGAESGARARMPFAGVRTDLGPTASSVINLGLVGCSIAFVVFMQPAANDYFSRQAARLLPERAAEFMAAQAISGRLFNTYNGGGYLIYRLYPQQRVFVDGRYNPYPKSVLDDYFWIVDGSPGWFELLSSYGTDVVLCESKAPLRQLLLLRPEFRLVYTDDDYSVMVRNDARYAMLPTVLPLSAKRDD